MKMAKASEADISMAMDLANVMDDIERGYFPAKFSDDEEEGIEWIDTHDREQYEKLIDGLKLLLKKGSISRVIWGMAVVCDPENEAIDPVADTIEHHPKRLQLEKQRDEYQSERQREHDLRVRISGELETVTKQRDELLTICKNVVELGIGASDVNAMKEAIASVKGQQ